MNEIEQLETQIKELKLKQGYSNLIESFNKTKETFFGKCFASKGLKYSTIGKYTKLNNLTLNRITNVYFGDKYNHFEITSFEDYKNKIQCCGELKIVVEAEEIYISCVDDKYHFNITKSKDYPHLIKGFCYEIPQHVYDNLKNIISNSIDSILCEPIKEIKNVEYQTCGRVKHLEKYGCKFIQISPDEEYVLDEHPFKYCDRLLVNDLSIQIVKDIMAEEMKWDANDQDRYFCGARIRRVGNHGKRVNMLSDILKKMQNVNL